MRIKSLMQNYKNQKNNRGMTLPELIMAFLMLTAFTGVFVLVSRFTANFLRPINSDGQINYELSKDNSIEDNDMADILNDHLQINITIDSIINVLTQPGTLLAHTMLEILFPMTEKIGKQFPQGNTSEDQVEYGGMLDGVKFLILVLVLLRL